MDETGSGESSSETSYGNSDLEKAYVISKGRNGRIMNIYLEAFLSLTNQVQASSVKSNVLHNTLKAVVWPPHYSDFVHDTHIASLFCGEVDRDVDWGRHHIRDLDTGGFPTQALKVIVRLVIVVRNCNPNEVVGNPVYVTPKAAVRSVYNTGHITTLECRQLELWGDS